MRNGNIIECSDLSVGYAGVPVLRGVNLCIKAGMFLPFVGPNGAGKTTLLRTILGLLRPLRGVVHTPFAATPPGYVAQQKSIDMLYPVSALDIVMMGCYPLMGWSGRRSAEGRRRALNLLEAFGLTEHAHKTFDELSGGMRQKVLVARALVMDPAVVVMDEPTTELDESTRRFVLHKLCAAAHDHGRTVLLVHHGLASVMALADEVCLVHKGRAELMPTDQARF
ncbi:MAG: metal ABC transporter ATP-binding protein [Kiritimatiellia bacterium]|nr:ATP-binding cassette domain-containing protein [Lentisphaerota bacterium]